MLLSFVVKDVTNYKTITYVMNVSLYMNKRLRFFEHYKKSFWNIYTSNTL